MLVNTVLRSRVIYGFCCFVWFCSALFEIYIKRAVLMYVLSYQASVSLSNPAYQSISECLFLYQLLKLFNNK